MNFHSPLLLRYSRNQPSHFQMLSYESHCHSLGMIQLVIAKYLFLENYSTAVTDHSLR